MNSYIFIEAEKNSINADFISKLEEYANLQKRTIYVLNRPLTDQKYSYDYSSALILLSPNAKITIIDLNDKNDLFGEYVEDIIEDIGSISDKYLYKNVIGRPRKWKQNLIETGISIADDIAIEELFQRISVSDEKEKKKIDLLISLFIGSINDIERVKEEVPQTTLDKVKQKIQLFDGDQTRFVYQKIDNKRVTIQGLSGTGKTELLLHKLKDLYINDKNSKMFFTCYNKILANSLKKRVPSFFNFMKVEKQIEWENRLWCTNAWGSASNPRSGAYRYICAFYQIPFYRFSYQMSFSRVCTNAIEDIKAKYEKKEIPFALDYMFIDESQDFDESFFELCELVTKKNIYVAGDIFQSIFDENIPSTIEPDFLLGKCYRTDPKTLMFAHALGMGLFEDRKLRWLEEKEWKDCGYNVEVENNVYSLSREPLRRFEDLDEDYESIKIVAATNNYSDTVVSSIQQIIEENNSVLPDDIGIILLDQNRSIYKFADILEVKMHKHFGWEVNKAYETKEKQANKILISNRNNVKGLEFPFVICVTGKIQNSPSYRNSIYTMLTRSFIKSFLLIPTGGLKENIENGLKNILSNKVMTINEPTEEEKKNIQTRFQYSLKKLSHYDLMLKIFKEQNIEKKYHDKLFAAAKQMNMFESDIETLTNFVLDNLKYING